ncbi:hypothetical protein CANINC_002190 [Pichia inconspicua]|uniref:Uncharacterized protein n=1 Tax=Pichia inconspicua TaxID=52247 RepID=A0A4V4NFR9_9ASCO|nr:hypothetical protein CANINC_002190 [[Candida] inconspicua]
MVKKVAKTASTRKFSYKSFRDHVDSIKIDPLKDIKRKAFHDVEISHFLSTLEHWREVNLSKNFQELVEIVEPITLSLPLLLYNKDKIFDALEKTISYNDTLSLQPSLELLSQFCHDLGPDFMEYYLRTLELIKTIALDQKDPQSLELIFNALAYIFKYLSRVLINDLIPTFHSLLPLLTVEKKDYINRFASEALSFLIRKLRLSSLKEFINDVFNTPALIENNSPSYHLALTVMFTESLKSAAGVLHSKTGIILPALASVCLQNAKFTAVLSDIVMELLDYTENSENSKLLYTTLVTVFTKALEDPNYLAITNITQLLLTLSFAESGRRVEDWNEIIKFVDPLYIAAMDLNETVDDDDPIKLNFSNAMVSWCAVMIRNADMSTLSKKHLNIVKAMNKLNGGAAFLAFIDAASGLNKDRTIQFANNSVTSFITQNWKDNYKEIAFFLEKMHARGIDSQLNIIVSNDFKTFVLESFKNIKEIKNKNALINNYWRLLILQYCSIQFDPELLIHFSQLLSSIDMNSDHFTLDVYGSTIGALSKQNLNDDQLVRILELSLKNFTELIESALFLSNFEKLVLKIQRSSEKSLKLIESSKDKLILSLANILKFPSHETRELALNLIITIFSTVGDPVPDAVSACRVIEQIPLTLQNARDVPLRFRHLAQNYSTESPLTNHIVANFLFGQLSNKFSPSWQGVQEFSHMVVNQLSDLLWKLSMDFISMNYKSLQEKPYLHYNFEDESNETSDISIWLPQDKRLHTMMTNFEKDIYHQYENVSHAIVSYTETLRNSIIPSDFTRYQVIKLLNKIPQLAEDNFKDLLPFIINEDADDVGDARTGSLLEGWTMADRNGLIELMTHFKKLRKVPSIDKVKDLLYILLMDRQVEIQKLALEWILNLHDETLNRYQKHLRNLLDDTLFRDEIVMFLQNKNDSVIQTQDIPTLLPLVLRIVFGRAQTLKTNSTKVGRKVAAIKSLNSMSDKHITEFLELTYCRFDFGTFKETGVVEHSTVNRKLLKNIVGFINMNLEVTETLGRNHRQCLEVLVDPLLYSLSVAEYAIEHAESFEDPIIEKSARNGRKSGFKLFYQLMQYLGDDYDWKPYGDLIYRNLIKSKMTKFGEENLSSASSLMKIMTRLWCNPKRLFFLYMDDFKPLKALLSILPNQNAKDVVLVLILQFILALLNLPTKDHQLVELLSIVISECLESLVLILEHSTNNEVNSLAVQVLLLFVTNDYVTDNNNRKVLLESLTVALEKPTSQLEMSIKIDIVRMIATLVEDYDCSFNDIIPIYSNIAKLYSTCEKSDMRNVVSTVFYGVANRFKELEKVCHMVIELNAYDSKKFREPDYDRRLQAFSSLNEYEYLSLSTIEWIPIIYTCMFFINDENDQSLRSSSGYTFTRYIDCLNAKPETKTEPYLKQLKELVIPTIRNGLKKKNDQVRAEYVRVLDHIVKNGKYYNDLADMKVLLLYDNEDEESDFFEDIIHLQTYRRQKALRGLSKIADKISSNSIAHYILPIIEHYAFWTDEKYRNVANETINTVKIIAQSVSWNQYKAILNRYVGIMNNAKAKEQTEKLRDSVLLIVAMSSTMRNWSLEANSVPSDYPADEKIDTFVCDLLPKLNKILSVKDESTVVIRVPISEAMIAFVMCCSQEKIDSQLAGLLTNICQILRARSENLRDSVRKHLGRIAVFLGPHYLKFIIKELKGALTRGPQIHILSYTIHHLLTVMGPYLEHGTLGESVPMIMECIMNDIFGEASEDKEATGYSSKAKEIKHNKSFDTGELVSASIFLKDFNYLLTPVKYLLNERLSFKSQNKLEQLMQRFANGLNRNEEGSSTDILVLCNEIFNQATSIVESKKREKKVVDEKTERFLVQLDARPQKTENEYSLYATTLQQFAFDLLKTAISKHDNLFKATYMAPFVPILQSSLTSENEGVVISSLKVLTMLVRLKFEPEVDSKFTDAANNVLKILQDIPSTNNEICQNCLKFLSNVIRFKDDLELKDSAVSYILKKVEPDLDSPERQATAFGFLKSITYKKIMIPEIYDCMDIVSKLMVTSTTNEIRQTARSTFYTFLMEYDQSRGRLEKQFKLLINNLKYPAYAGRLSVLELIATIVRKSSKDLLGKLTTSFFIALANVSVTDDYPSCRENASEILGLMFKRLSESEMDMGFIEKYTSVWLTQNKKSLLVRCGLNVYKIYVDSVGYGLSENLDKLAHDRITRTLKSAKRAGENDEDNSYDEDKLAVVESEWQMMYSCLIVFEVLTRKINTFTREFEQIWNSIIDSLLYPHSWIRLASSRLVNKLLLEIIENKSPSTEIHLNDATIQTIAFRTFRQLGAPNISEKLAEQDVANLVLISKKWNTENTKFITFKKEGDEQSDEPRNKKVFENAFDWALNRCASILKNDSRDHAEMMMTKRFVIKFFEFLTVFLDEVKLKAVLSETILVPLLHISEQDFLEDENEENALPTLATACLELLSKKIGISEYNILLSAAMKTIQKRRQERKTKRAQLTLNNPEVAARRKLKKHFNVREKRKNNKDENGYYKAKRRRI